jgi:hypothetical protein
MVRSLQAPKVLEDYPCAYNYSGKVSDVLPLKPDVLLGHRVWTWNNWGERNRGGYFCCFFSFL